MLYSEKETEKENIGTPTYSIKNRFIYPPISSLQTISDKLISTNMRNAKCKCRYIKSFPTIYENI